MDKNINVLKLMENVIFLKKYTLFTGLDTEELRSIAVICEELNVKDGDCVVKEGDAGESMFIVKRGELKIIKGKGETAVQLAVIPKNAFFGEMVLFEEGQLRSANAIAIGDCTLLVLRRDDLLESMKQHPLIAFEFIKMFGQRLSMTNEQLRETREKLFALTREKSK